MGVEEMQSIFMVIESIWRNFIWSRQSCVPNLTTHSANALSPNPRRLMHRVYPADFGTHSMQHRRRHTENMCHDLSPRTDSAEAVCRHCLYCIPNGRTPPRPRVLGHSTSNDGELSRRFRHRFRQMRKRPPKGRSLPKRPRRSYSETKNTPIVSQGGTTV